MIPTPLDTSHTDLNLKTSSPKYNRLDDIAISYYRVDEKRKVWIRAPFIDNFVIEEPYHGDDRFSVQSEECFKIPFLKQINTTVREKSSILMAILWIKDYQLYTDQIVKTGHEFYRCISKNHPLDYYNWILIPLYSRYPTKQVRFPVWTYNVENFRNTIIIKNYDILYQLCDMFNPVPQRYINAFSVVIHDKMKWMVQFNDAPAMFL